jgi:hypothetical protein
MQPAYTGFLLGLLFDPDDGAVPSKHDVLFELYSIATQNKTLFIVTTVDA